MLLTSFTVICILAVVRLGTSLPHEEQTGRGYPQEYPRNHNHNQYNPYEYPTIHEPKQHSNVPLLHQTNRVGWCRAEITTGLLNRMKNETRLQNQPWDGDQTIGTVEMCCEGYKKRVIHKEKHCLPVCDDCENGFCIAPQVCECFPDHVKNLAGQCVHTCPIGCLNGICNYDGTCTCRVGYELEHNGKFCVPKCDRPCDDYRHRNCTRPNFCACKSGYKSDKMHNCQPICKRDCGEKYNRGRCTAPNECTCNYGFSLKNDTCQSECEEECVNGICAAPNVCQCEEGYALLGKVCLPYCSNCQNGNCIGPEKCRCNQGYKNDGDSKCVPRCDNECNGHGTCVGPNQCACTDGYRSGTYFSASHIKNTPPTRIFNEKVSTNKDKKKLLLLKHIKKSVCLQ